MELVNQRKQSITQRIFLLMIFLIILIVTNFLVMIYYDSQLAGIDRTVSLAGQNRTYAIQIAFFAQLVKNKNETYKKPLKEALEKHIFNLRILRSGGIAEAYRIPPLPEDLVPTYTITERFWRKYQENAEAVVSEPLTVDSLAFTNPTLSAADSINKAKVNTANIKKVKIPNPKLEAAVEFLLANAVDMYDKDNEFVGTYLTYYDGKQTQRNNVFLIIITVNLALLMIGMLYINNSVISPLNRISSLCYEIITQGDFTKRIAYDKNDELGRIAYAINVLFESLENATESITAVGEGKLDVEFQHNDLIREDRLMNALVEMRDKMLEVSEQDRQRNWVAEGTALFADILRKNLDSDNFGYIIISNLVKYLEANQGALFIINDEDEYNTYLELTAAYAFGKRKYVEKNIEKGEGLIGEVYQEGVTIYLTEVPENYINITSGLGDSNPRAILITPLKMNEVLYGVVEIASFHPFEKYQIDFVNRLGESIATTFSSIKSNQKTQRLLEESVTLSERMRKQEAELRQEVEALKQEQQTLRLQMEAIDVQKSSLERTLDDQIIKNEALGQETEMLRETITDLNTNQEQLRREQVLVDEKRTELQNIIRQKDQELAIKQKLVEDCQESIRLKEEELTIRLQSVIDAKEQELARYKKRLEELGDSSSSTAEESI